MTTQKVYQGDTMYNYGTWKKFKKILSNSTTTTTSGTNYKITTVGKWEPDDDTPKIIQLLELYFSGRFEEAIKALEKDKSDIDDVIMMNMKFKAPKPDKNIMGTVML